MQLSKVTPSQLLWRERGRQVPAAKMWCTQGRKWKKKRDVVALPEILFFQPPRPNVEDGRITGWNQ